MQTRQELATAYEKVCRLHDRSAWQLGPPRPVSMRLTSMDGPSDVRLDALEAVIAYASASLGIDFDLVGGGAGCFDLVLGAETGEVAAIDLAVEDDLHFQALLNELGVHLLRLRVPSGTRAYAAHVPIMAGLVTNRGRNPKTALTDPMAAFGCTLGANLSFGVVVFHVLDLAGGQTRPTLMRRIWRKISLGLGDIRNKRFDVTVARLDIVDQAKFEALVAQADAKAILLSIHGYANDFPAAMESFSRFIYNTGLDRMSHFPILFSWPSSGNPATYLPQAGHALNSRKPLFKTFQLLCDAARDRPVNVIAHSHGNDILVAVARDRAQTNARPLL